MKKLISGYRKFRADVYPKRSEEFKRLEKGQDPETLFITCSDSRIVPDLLLQTSPGELFICRNAGNIVPAFGDFNGGVTATVEYAIRVLQVKHIVVCGHSDCGVMRGLLHPEKVGHMRSVSHWLAYGERARVLVEETYKDSPEEEKVWELAKQNVLAQLDNLRTHPAVAAALAKQSVQLHAWLYRLHTASIFAQDKDSGDFVPLEDANLGSSLKPNQISAA